MKIDVVCPLYQAEKEIEQIITNIKKQKEVEINKIIFPITISKDSEKTIEFIKNASCTYFTVEKEDFSHSLTREKAMNEYCESDVVVMITQDAIVEDEYAFYYIASAVNKNVPYAYGKQISKKKNIEYYTRKKNYGEVSHQVESKDVEKMGLLAFFASDAFSAYYRPLFLEIGGYDSIPMMMNEDMYYAKKIIDKGYKKAYVAEAKVVHSHNFTLKQLYKRYYDTGVWFTEHSEFDNYNSTSSGLSLAFYVFRKALLHFNIPVLFRLIPDMLARYLGMKKGKKISK